MELLYKLKCQINKYLAVKATKEESVWNDTDTGVKVHYLLKKKANTDALMIVFSAAHAEEPRYSYLSVLNGVHASRLYIKDDFSPKTGDYYIGSNMNFQEEVAVSHLINDTINQLNPKRVYFVGSSKGGYAALNFGLMYPNAYIIAGAPQYFLGTYMSDVKKFRPALEHITGKPFEDITDNDREIIDNRLKTKIQNDSYKDTQKLYIHCSINESTFDKHVKWLLEDLKAEKFHMSFNEAYYNDHSDLRLYFPDYIKECFAGTERDHNAHIEGL